MKIILSIVMVLFLVACDMAGDKSIGEFQGKKVEPVRPLMDMVLLDVEGNALSAKFLKGPWSYLVFAEDSCDELCEQQLSITRQVVLSNKDKRVTIQRVLVLAFEPDKSWVKELRQQHPELIVTVLTRPIWSAFYVQFLAEAQAIGGNPFFLVNPKGLLVMGYDDLVEAKDVSSDFDNWQSVN